jgi:exopolysaccharide biosynthesis polyprenyl glycosylphosphotransferase
MRAASELNFRDSGVRPRHSEITTWLRVGRLVTTAQILGDGASVILAYLASALLWPLLLQMSIFSVLHEEIPRRNYLVNCLVTLCVIFPVFKTSKLYEEHHSLLNIREYHNILRGWAMTALLTLLAVTSIEQSFQSRGIFLLVWGLLLSFLFFFRFAAYRLGIRLRAAGWRDKRILIYGAGDSGRILSAKLKRSPKTGLEVAGFLDDDPALHGRTLDGCEVLGSGAEMGQILKRTGATEIVIALPRAPRNTIARIVETCVRHGAEYRLVPSLFDIALTQVDFTELGGIPLLGVHTPRISPLSAVAKRLVDISLATLAMIALAPIAAVVAISIRLTEGGPVFFVQKRVGRGGRVFRMHKFRTMRPNSPTYAPTPQDESDPRVTPVGRWLRRTSLDEIPQLWNVLKGDMSLVGPRPEMPFIVSRYNEAHRQRLNVKPGLTGLWQISPDRALAIHENMDYDLYYIRNQSQLLDLAIMAKTVTAVLRGQGAF